MKQLGTDPNCTFCMAKILGIVNVTPDSFWSESRVQDKASLVERVRLMISQGADAIDVGGCSTRPGAVQASEDEVQKTYARDWKQTKRNLRIITITAG